VFLNFFLGHCNNLTQIHSLQHDGVFECFDRTTKLGQTVVPELVEHSTTDHKIKDLNPTAARQRESEFPGLDEAPIIIGSKLWKVPH